MGSESQPPHLYLRDPLVTVVNMSALKAVLLLPSLNPQNIRRQVSRVPPVLSPESGTALDDFVISTAAAYNSFNIVRVDAGTESASLDSRDAKVQRLCRLLVKIFGDLERYRRFLGHRDQEAQNLLDCLQTLLDAGVNERLRLLFLVALLRLTRKSERYPQSLMITDLTYERDAVADGSYGVIHQGMSRGKQICLKVFKVRQGVEHAALRKAFLREGVLSAQQIHPNVLPHYGIYELGDKWQRIGLVLGVAAGMEYLHKNGIVHGDIKSYNVLINDNGGPCLADFGLSFIKDSNGIQHRDLSSDAAEGGTLFFRAPELILERKSFKSRASDVYAFAMTSYQIFTDHPPFYERRDSTYAVMSAIAKGKRPTFPEGKHYIKRGLTDRMKQLLRRCWNQDPKGRQTSSQIHARLCELSIGTQAQDSQSAGWGDLSPDRFRATGSQEMEFNDSISTVGFFDTLESLAIRSD
ncbi:hypothetical protein C0995_009140 [Termitomyces sp. Mi166|nr:hypothetical protein C0995_009140 [Termitomyces sp. Mi166\